MNIHLWECVMNMKCIQVREVGSFVMTETPVPEPGLDEVLVKVEVAGLCRTDLKLIRVGHRDLTLPRIPAEEVVGRIWRVGESVTEFEPGERVYIYPGVWCGECPACRSGADNLCRNMLIMGFHRDGGFAEYVKAPARSLIRVPEGLAPEQAVFAEPLSCCLNALELGRVAEGEEVGIWGAGPAGTLLARAARAMGAATMNMEPDRVRREAIGGLEVNNGKLFDVCVVAVGSREAYLAALTALKPRGRLVVFSGLPLDNASFPVEFNHLHYHEQTLVGAYGCSYRHGRQALEWLSCGRVEVCDLVSHRLPLRELGRALELVERRNCMKILLYP